MKHALAAVALLGLSAAMLVASPAFASKLDTCVLDHMGQASTDFAAKEIKIACVRASETEIPVANWPSLASWAIAFESVSYSWGTPHWAMVIHSNNDSPNAISEVTVKLTRHGVESLYVVRHFNNVEHWRQGDPIVTGLPPDPTWNMIMHRGASQFLVPSSETPTPAEVKSGTAAILWNVVAIKGWVD